ncbi:MAG: CarD family transcriptional regulator [Acutalibacteraceae bacterium]|nr:CarD family transcriptional regulator [Acutalibacteraceae bacterium]
MYSIGATVIYRNEGVCEITDIIVRRFKDKDMEYYVLKPIYKDNAEIYVPKNNAELVSKMKKVLTKDEILELINAMPCEEDIWVSNESDRKDKYKEILARGDRTELVRLIKTLYIHKQNQKKAGKKLHLADERFLKDAERILYDEFAYVLNIAQDEVLPFIMGKIEATK